jgi:2-polyprenyl-6-methoxyphenol hydroxylase-like FAD-dependent oxidoreductase
LIVGGGIGGLFAANALRAQGLRVSVYEQAPALGEVGAGVYVTPNAVRHLERVGLGPAVEKFGARVGPDSAYFRHDGAPVARVQVSDAAGWNACFGMHRADYVDFLAANLPPGVVRTGHRAIAYDEAGAVARVRFANGAVAEADVVVGADGIHSEMRPFGARRNIRRVPGRERHHHVNGPIVESLSRGRHGKSGDETSDCLAQHHAHTAIQRRAATDHLEGIREIEPAPMDRQTP